MPLCIVYLASPRAAFDGLKLELLQSSILVTKQVFPSTDIFVFHEDLTTNDVPSYVKLVEISFDGQQQYFTYNKNNRGYGYSMMSRFFSGIMQSHPILQPYTHYLRLDDDSFFIKPCNIDVDSFLKYDYVYRTTFYEETHDQTSLLKFTESFLHKRGLSLATFNKQLAPYNNFHVSSFALWKHPLVREYINEIESRHLILQSGFLDANIHAFIIWALLPHTKLKLYVDQSFGYRHTQHVSAPGVNGYRHMPKVPSLPSHTNIETMEELNSY